MNLGQLKDAVYDFLGQSSTDNNISPSEITRYANEAQSQVFAVVAEMFEGFFRTNTTLSEVAGTATIALPNNCYRVTRLEREKNSGGPLPTPYVLFRMNDSRQDIDGARGFHGTVAGYRSGGEYGYIQHGQNQIELHPTPTESVTDSLRLHYTYRPAEMTDDNHVPFQATAGTGSGTLHDLQEYHDILWKWALLYALAKEEATMQYQMIMGQYNQRMTELRQYLDRVNEAPTHVNWEQGDGYVW